MNQKLVYKLLADAVLLLHFAVAAFIVISLLLIIIGAIKKWKWIRNPWFRYLHLCAIAFVIIQTWLGKLCPLTHLENYFRIKAGETDYPGSFVVYWLGELLYYNLPMWMFAVFYSIFGMLVLFCWIKFKPNTFS